MKVYIATSGRYSDRRIMGVYSNEELATKAQDLYDADNTIEEFELDIYPDSPPGLFPWSVGMDADGNMPELYGGNPEREKAEDFKEMYLPYSRYGKEKILMFYVWARDSDHAIKISGEKRAQLIATGRWTLDWDECLRRYKDGEQ